LRSGAQLGALTPFLIGFPVKRPRHLPGRFAFVLDADRAVVTFAAMARKNEFNQPIGDPLAGVFPRPLPPRTPMEGRYCRLVPVSPEHAAGLFEAYSTADDGRGWTYLPLEPFETEDACRKWLEGAEKSDDPLFFTVLDNGGVPVGWASFLRIDPANGVAEVGWINFSPRLQRTPASTEAMFLMMTRVFDELGYRRYEWKCDALNGPSRRAAERLGFQYEGTFRQHMQYKNRNRDTAWFAILDRDWQAQKARFQAWLDPSNFDADGQQKTSLRAK